MIHLCLTHDWELRGNGSGDIERIQFEPLRRLLEIYGRLGARTTINAEVMQQLAFRRFQEDHAELGPLADEWDALILEARRLGHDVQLHVHPQWSAARYYEGRWRLADNWSILDYDSRAAYSMLAECKDYLENLLRAGSPSYRCVAFRAGSLAIAPSPHALNLLVSLGIECDTSIAGGLHFDTSHVRLDYRSCEEDFLPYYPRMTDARKVSDKVEQIVCVPIHHFYGSRRQLFRRHISFVRRKLGRTLSVKQGARASDGDSRQDWADKSHRSPLSLLRGEVVEPYLRGKHFVSDVARLSYPLLREMLEALRRDARASGLVDVPVVLTNHPKDIQDFAAIERFVAELSNADDIRFITLSELNEKLKAGEFKIRVGNKI